MASSTHRLFLFLALTVALGCTETPVNIRGDVEWGLDSDSFTFQSEEFLTASGDPIAVCELSADGGTSFGLLDQTSGRNMLVVEVTEDELRLRGEANGVAIIASEDGECAVDFIERDLSFGELSLSVHCDVEARIGEGRGKIEATVEATGCRTSNQLTRLGRAVGGLF